MTKLIVAFRDVAKMPKNKSFVPVMVFGIFYVLLVAYHKLFQSKRRFALEIHSDDRDYFIRRN